MKKHNSNHLSMRTKLTLIMVSILLLLGIVTTGLSYYIVKDSNLTNIDSSLYDKGLILSKTMSEERIQSILDNPSASNEDAILLTEEMDKINEESESITNLYLITVNGENIHAPVLSSSILDLGAEYNQDMVAMGLSDDLLERIKSVYAKKEATATEVYSDEFGSFKTGLTPIISKNGEVLAVYAIDYDVSMLTKAMSEVMKILMVTIVFLVLSSIVVYFLMKRKLMPIQKLSLLSKEVTNGNLEIKLLADQSKDEIGELTRNFNQMIHTLKSVLESTAKVSTRVSDSAQVLSTNMQDATDAYNNIARTMQEIASNADVQADKSKDSSVTIEEISTGIQRIALTSNQISESSIRASEEAEKGNISTLQSVKQINAISKAVNESASSVKNLGTHSEKIEEIVGIITGIASQTNLLALNAAIEAARAGEAGSGFAVVADEVRKLAEQSEASAREISTLITHIQHDTNESVNMMMHAVEEVNSGLEVINESEKSFAQIASSIQQVSDQIQDLTATIEEMSAGMHEVTASVQEIENLSSLSKENTKFAAETTTTQLEAVQQVSDEAQILSDLSTELMNVANTFKLNKK